MKEARSTKRRRVPFLVAGVALFCTEQLSFGRAQVQCEECRQPAARERETPIPLTAKSNGWQKDWRAIDLTLHTVS
jgi:hypothetical protein